jgi:hypothetical protein
MKRFVVIASLLASSAFATEQKKDFELQAQFSAALSVVIKATDQVTQQSTVQGADQVPQYGLTGVPNLIADYESGKITQQITSTIRTPAAQILRDVSEIVYEMSVGLYEGVAHPTTATKEKVCATIYRGFDAKRNAPFYEGYAVLHKTFQRYVDQFTEVSDILQCPAPF